MFGRRDFVFPPKCREAGTDYILITDDSRLEVEGWCSWTVDISDWGNATMANRYYKFFAQDFFTECDVSLYLDGNLRIVGPLQSVFDEFMASRACLGLKKHPFRRNVAEEIDQCTRSMKLAEPNRAHAELAYYRQQGFDDSPRLTENNVLLRNHRHSALAPAMELWWHCFSRFETRDQFSLPFVRWRTGVPCHLFGFDVRPPNPFFHYYRHRTPLLRSNLLRYCEARMPDHGIFRLLFSLGHPFENLARNSEVWRTSSVMTPPSLRQD